MAGYLRYGDDASVCDNSLQRCGHSLDVSVNFAAREIIPWSQQCAFNFVNIHFCIKCSPMDVSSERTAVWVRRNPHVVEHHSLHHTHHPVTVDMLHGSRQIYLVETSKGSEQKLSRRGPMHKSQNSKNRSISFSYAAQHVSFREKT